MRYKTLKPFAERYRLLDEGTVQITAKVTYAQACDSRVSRHAHASTCCVLVSSLASDELCPRQLLASNSQVHVTKHDPATFRFLTL